MTVKEMIEALQDFDHDAQVRIVQSKMNYSDSLPVRDCEGILYGPNEGKNGQYFKTVLLLPDRTK